NARRPDGPDGTAGATALGDRARGLRRHRVPLLVHHVGRGILDLNRLERSRTHVEQYFGASDAARLEACEQFRREMEAGGRRRDGARLPRTGHTIYATWRAQ